MSIGRICNRTVYLAVANETARTAAKRMAEHNVGTLLIVNDRRQPIGILTDRDLVTRVMATSKNPQKTLVGDVMTHRPITISEATPIEAAIATMRSGGFRRMPVVGESEHLVGVVSLDDVLALLAEEFTKIGGVLAAVSHQRP
jgi:CBS domain-containing protein